MDENDPVYRALNRKIDRLQRLIGGYRLRRNAARRFVRATGRTAPVPPKLAGHPGIEGLEASAARLDPATCSHDWQKRCSRCGAVGRMPKQIPRDWLHSPEDF